MNTKNILIEYRNFDRCNKLCYVNTVFQKTKENLVKSCYQNHISFYGAISDRDNKILPMRLELFSRGKFSRRDINVISAFIYQTKPIGYTICKYVRGVLYPIITQFEIEKIRGV
jgi:hypothetical protein